MLGKKKLAKYINNTSVRYNLIFFNMIDVVQIICFVHAQI